MSVQPTDNKLLAVLESAELEPLLPHLELVHMRQHDPLIEPRVPIRHVYFPVTLLGSLVTVFEDGSTVESGTIGREGMTGVPVVLNAEQTPMLTVVQIEGDAFRIPSEVLKQNFDRGKSLHVILNKYIHTLFVVASQSGACNRRHQVEARLARWLLMSSDGIGADDIAITQEFLATMLGVRRPGVTEAAVKLQDEGMIQYKRGGIRIVDREALEDASCECYHAVRNEFERLFSTDPAPVSS